MQDRSLADMYTLSNGVKIPVLGFGTWKLENNAETSSAVTEAIRLGYRHIDTAAAYHNEEAVGQGIKQSGIPREELFVTTKLANSVRGYEETKAAFLESLEKLELDYVDLYLFHWPRPSENADQWKELNAASMRAMEDLVAEGKIRSIGVSNFKAHHIDALLKTAKEKIVVNQIKICPGAVDEETIRYCEEHEIHLEAYSPLGHGMLLENDVLSQIAEEYQKSVAQIALRWSLQKGFIPMPKTKSIDRIAENADIFDFELQDSDMIRIDELDIPALYASDPDKK